MPSKLKLCTPTLVSKTCIYLSKSSIMGSSYPTGIMHSDSGLLICIPNGKHCKLQTKYNYVNRLVDTYMSKAFADCGLAWISHFPWESQSLNSKFKADSTWLDRRTIISLLPNSPPFTLHTYDVTISGSSSIFVWNGKRHTYTLYYCTL
jgi:hypothetical protein